MCAPLAVQLLGAGNRPSRAIAFAQPCPLRVCASSPSPRPEVPLGERGDEADLDEEADYRLDRCQRRHWITQALQRLEDAGAMEGGIATPICPSRPPRGCAACRSAR